jgi:ATP-dependent helicase HrpB
MEATLRGGRKLRVHYEKGRAPWIESRLQDFFGMSEGPTLLKGKLPLQIHFLAPNQIALQVTTDLPGFWERHYPDLRKQLMRKYPRHLWPEDGKTASPPTPGKIR